jgi:hypothetical protein
MWLLSGECCCDGADLDGRNTRSNDGDDDDNDDEVVDDENGG